MASPRPTTCPSEGTSYFRIPSCQFPESGPHRTQSDRSQNLAVQCWYELNTGIVRTTQEHAKLWSSKCAAQREEFWSGLGEWGSWFDREVVQEGREVLFGHPYFAVDLIVGFAERDDLVVVPEPYGLSFDFGQSFTDVLGEAR